MTDDDPRTPIENTPDATVPVGAPPPADQAPAPEPTVPVGPGPARSFDGAAPEETPSAAGATPRRPGLDRRMILLGVGSGLLAVILGLLLLMVFAPNSAPVKLGAVSAAADARRSEEVERVAVRFASALYSFNYRTIDADLERIRADSTGGFSRELEQVLGEVDVFKKAIVEAQGSSTGEVQGVDVREISDDTATARVFVVQSIRNKKNPEPRQQFSAVELTLVRTADDWKVDNVQQFNTRSSGAPGAQ